MAWGGVDPARPRSGREDRRSGCRRPRCGLAAPRRRGHVTRVRAARRPAGTADGAKRRPWRGGSAYISGWYGYVDKDLRSLLDQPVEAPYSRRYCGAGVLATCRDALWGAIDAAAAELENTQGPAPSAWRADATARAHPFHVRRASGHDALDEPPDLPAAHVVLGAPPPLTGRRQAPAGGLQGALAAMMQPLRVSESHSARRR